MSSSLFRLEALEFQRTRAWSGTTTSAPPFSTWLLTTFFVVSIAAAAGFLATQTFGRKETVTGYLTPKAGVARLLASTSGAVAELYIADGDEVVAGQRLLSVQTERHGMRDQSVDATIVSHLQTKRSALLYRIRLEQQTEQQGRQSLSEAITELEVEVDSLTTSFKAQHQRTQVAHSQVESVRPGVAQGYTALTEFRRRQDAELAQQQAETDLYRQISAKAAEVQGKRHTLTDLETKSADNIAVLKAAVDDVEVAIAEANGKQGYVLTAPISGRISNLQASVGMSVGTSIPLMSIVPKNAPLEVVLLIPARAIGFIARGQTISLAFDPFPFQRYGFYQTTVDAISDTELTQGELIGPIVLKEPCYRVTAHLEHQTVQVGARELPLRSDMSLTAHIEFDRRSLFEFLFEPMLIARGKIRPKPV